MTSFSQTITGSLTDRDTKESVIQCTVHLLNAKDSSFVGGTVSDEKGRFSVKVPQRGSFLLKITSVGYKPYRKIIHLDEIQDITLGEIVMGSDAVMLKGATVTGQASKVTLKEDTFIYNAAAYRTSEGSTVEELVKRILGAQVDDDGKITINGREVKKILVDGKEFMPGDTKTALKNLPSSIIEQIRSYDQSSDLTRISGIDDGEEEAVLDFGIKKGMNHGMFSNIDAGIGTKDRYSARGMGAFMKDKSRFMVFANANNTNDMGFPGGGGRNNSGASRQGLNSSKMLGLNYNYEVKDKVILDASLRWNHNDGDANSKSSTENFVSTKKSKSFGNSISQRFSRSNSIDGNMRFEWKPDSLTNIIFRPSFQWSDNDATTSSQSASFNDDPYIYVENPLLSESILKMDADSVMINTKNNIGLSYSDSKSIRGVLQLNRKLGSKGRNVTIRVKGNYGKNDGKSLSLSNVHLYQIIDALGNDSTYQTNRWNLTPRNNYGYGAQFTYSEPLWKGTYLQFNYQYSYSFRKSDRSTYI